jgi:hypothetical protein
MVDTDGKVYRIISHSRVAYHAGRSMWGSRTSLDNRSVGIEIVGYHNKSFTTAQYVATRELIEQIQSIYRVPDSRVLPHSMVAYGAPNRWHKRSHRGRKRCAMLLAQPSVRQKLGLTSGPSYDPDQKSGRLVQADPYLQKVLFGSQPEQLTAVRHFTTTDAQVISADRSAWDIARDQYKSSDVTYILPDGTRKTGNQISDWGAMQPGTRVVFGGTAAPSSTVANLPPSYGINQPGEGVQTIGTDGSSARDIAGDEYNQKSVIYFLTNGQVRRGDELSATEINSLGRGTRLLVGYVHGGYISAKRSAFDVCGDRWNAPTTYYRLSDGSFKTGDTLSERAIPSKAMVFFEN